MACFCGKPALYKDQCSSCYYKARRIKDKTSRAAYDKVRRQRPEVKAREAARTKERRSTDMAFWARCLLHTSRHVAKKAGHMPIMSDVETLVLLREVFEAEINCCYACKKPVSFGIGVGPNSAVIDHCHKTGKLRGVVCNECNHKIGIIEGETKNAEQYLQDFG